MRRPAHLRRVARKIATIIGAPAEMDGLTVVRIQAGGIRLGDVAVDMSCRECGVRRLLRLLRLGSRGLEKYVRRLGCAKHTTHAEVGPRAARPCVEPGNGGVGREYLVV